MDPPPGALTCGDLFAGIGGMSLGLERAGFTVRWQVECEPYCENVLARHWPHVHRRRDVRFAGATTLERVDCIAGGFPCQDISVAGKGAGLSGKRSGLWSEFHRIIRELRPRWVLVENVPALRNRGADAVLGDLEAEGYSCWPLVVGARHVGAPHRRDRVWIIGRLADASGCRDAGRTGDGRPAEGKAAGDLRRGQIPALGRDGEPAFSGVAERLANAESRGWAPEGECGNTQEPLSVGDGLANAVSGRCRGGAADAEWRAFERTIAEGASAGVADGHGCGREADRRGGLLDGERAAFRNDADRFPARPGEPQRPWEEPRTVESPLGRATHGVSARLACARWRAELKALGNAVVPQVVEVIGRAMLAVEGGGDAVCGL